MLADIDRARDALQACDPSCARDEWVRLAMAAKAAEVDFDTFDSWSAQADNYNARDARAVWNSIRRTDGVGAGTLYKAAAQNGWAPDSRRRHIRPAKAAPRPVEPRTPPRHGMAPAEVWERCKPASESHGYIRAKLGRSEGLRVVPEGDALAISGQSVGADLNLTHPADLNLTRGWVPAS